MAALTVPTIFTAVDKLSSVISKMQGNVGKFASESQKKYAAMSRSAQAWSTNARSVAMSSGIMGAAFVAPLVLATKAAADFEDQMANIGTIVGEKNVPFLSKGVLELLKQTPFPLHDLTEGLYKVASAGIPAAKAMGVLKTASQLALTARGSTTQGADALTSAMNVFKDEGLSTNKMASLLNSTVKLGKTTLDGLAESFGATANITQNGGVKMKDFLSAVSAMTVMGEPASQAMNQVRASVLSLEKPSARMKIIFKELGVKSIQQLIGKYGNLGNAIQTVEDKSKKLGFYSAQVWGKVNAFNAVVALTGARGKSSYNSNLLGMNNSEADFAAAQAVKIKTLATQLKIAQNNMQAFSIVLGTQLIPLLTKALPKISAFVDHTIKWVENNKPLTLWTLKVVGALGLLLIAIAPFALLISGIADAVKIYAGIQLFFAERTAIATAAIEAQTLMYAGNAEAAYAAAYAAKAVTSVGFGGMLLQLSAVAGLALLIDNYWKSWGDSITAMLGPFGEVFNMIEQIKDKSSDFNKGEQEGGFMGFIHSFGSLIKGYSDSIGNFGISPISGIARDMGYDLNGKDHKRGEKSVLGTPISALMQQQAAGNSTTSKQYLGIDITAPAGYGVNTKQSGPLVVPVKTSSTTGNK